VSTGWVSDRLAAAAPIGLAELDAAARLQHRIDTKYLITPQQLDQVADRLSSTHRRLVIDGISAFAYRSSYLDTPGHACFHAHRQGRRLRFKIRTRCYDDTGLCRFEIKLKDGRGGTDKHARTVPATQFATVPDLAPAFVSDVLAARYGIAAPTDLAPRLLVSHHRHTLAAKSGRVGSPSTPAFGSPPGRSPPGYATTWSWWKPNPPGAEATPTACCVGPALAPSTSASTAPAWR
jgi:hypothetical protein